ncbi:ribosomal silencing factor RsfS [Philodulcilactobacillus myokoensis]|uniref:Ribosomal silencing factor RsfS n=1 Tax=Philodulcilactobacillus myokoensis TaxID=2929573 RepID=A0A9W6ES61_9LACO|nr:ribosome silencing factor [Philodulcilactobacillus myokoensis]GLB46761.1 ribosomal silencing factor RsfS [Philodulcilactobacillus myokoensis]
MNTIDILKTVVKSADFKQARNIVALDMRGISLMSDYYVIMDASSSRQVKAIANAIIESSEEHHIDVEEVEGRKEGQWILIDLDGVIVHVFESEKRSFYNLEKLWSDAPDVDVSKWEDPE